MYSQSMNSRSTDNEHFQKFCSQLSIVVTGPVHFKKDSKVPVSRLTERLLLQIKNEVPNVPIVLSTWNQPKFQENIKDLEIILSEDPGPQILGAHQSNLNRQIISSRNALSAIRTQYVLRIRTDFYFNDFNKTLRQFSKKIYNAQLLDKKLGVLDYSKLLFWQPYYICDFLQIGSIESVKKYWQAPLQSFEEFSTGHQDSCIHGIESCSLRIYPERFAPEQYLGLHYIFGENFEYPMKSRCQSSLVDFHQSFKDFNAKFQAFPIRSNSFGGRFLEISKREGVIRTNLTRLTRTFHPVVSTFILAITKSIKLLLKEVSSLNSKFS